MNCLNAAYSSPQTDTKLILNLKISIKIYLYYSNEVLGGFFPFIFTSKRFLAFGCFFKCRYSSQRQTKKSSEEQLPGISSFGRTSFSCSVISNSCDSMDCSMPGFPVLHYLLEFVQTHVHWVDDPIQTSHPLSPPSLALNLSQHQDFHITCTKYWSFSISTYNGYSVLISFKIDWFDLLAVQGTLKSVLQHNSSKASILRHSAFFMVQLSHPYMTTGTTVAMTV